MSHEIPIIHKALRKTQSLRCDIGLMRHGHILHAGFSRKDDADVPDGASACGGLEGASTLKAVNNKNPASPFGAGAAPLPPEGQEPTLPRAHSAGKQSASCYEIRTAVFTAVSFCCVALRTAAALILATCRSESPPELVSQS